MKPIKVIKKLNESSNNFEEQLRSVFHNLKNEPIYGGYEINNSGICISDACIDADGEYVEGFSFYSNPAKHIVFPDVESSTSFDIQAPRFLKDKSGVDYGDSIGFEGSFDINKVKEVFNELNSKKKEYEPAHGGNYATILESAELDKEKYFVLMDAIEDIIISMDGNKQQMQDLLNDVTNEFKRIAKEHNVEL